MDQASLVMDEIEAGADLIRRMGRFAPIKVAFWLRPDEEGRRKLYLSSDRFTFENRPDAYKEVVKILRERPTIFLDTDQVSLLSGDDRWARAAEGWSDEVMGAKLGSVQFGDEYIADAYVYPSPLPDRFPRLH